MNGDSELQKADLNGDGIVSEEELRIHLESKRLEMEDADAMRDAQRKMAWFALGGMLLYPFTVVLTDVFGLENASRIIGEMSGIYFLSVAGIVMAFYGKEALQNNKVK